MKTDRAPTVDIAGIGIGPFNLSLAALLQKSNITYQFFDEKKEFAWHEGMLLENAKVQVHFLKDLASCVDPSNPHTFLSYLVSQGRIYQFLNRKRNTISRHEFNHYFKWEAQHIPGLHFGEKVEDVHYKNGQFKIVTERNVIHSRHIAIGTGTVPHIPEQFKRFLDTHFFHNCEFKNRAKTINLSNKRIAIIGGGQSGAEVFDTIISGKNKPEKIIWASKQLNFSALEDSCFANEFYTPHYVKYFYHLPQNIREKKLREQRLTSDGITQEFSDEIYNKLYELQYIHNTHTQFELLTNHTLINVKKNPTNYTITLFDQDLNKHVDDTVDVVILATGYKSSIPECMKTFFLNNLEPDATSINEDYSLRWRHDENNKIFIQNGAKHTHGVADPNLSLAAWRNAIIINSLLNENFYKTEMIHPVIGRMELNLLKENKILIKPHDAVCAAWSNE